MTGSKRCSSRPTLRVMRGIASRSLSTESMSLPPAVFGSLDDAVRLFRAVRASGRKYMMFETSCFHEDLHAMRQIYQAQGFGKLAYSEGEYFHYMPEPLPSYKDWRVGLPPQFYPTNSNAYYVGVTGGSFTHLSGMGMA